MTVRANTPKTELTLSEAPDPGQEPDGTSPELILRAMLLDGTPAGVEAVIDYVFGPFAPPLTEAELRQLHGDR